MNFPKMILKRQPPPTNETTFQAIGPVFRKEVNLTRDFKTSGFLCGEFVKKIVFLLFLFLAPLRSESKELDSKKIAFLDWGEKKVFSLKGLLDSSIKGGNVKIIRTILD